MGIMQSCAQILQSYLTWLYLSLSVFVFGVIFLLSVPTASAQDWLRTGTGQCRRDQTACCRGRFRAQIAHLRAGQLA